MHKKQVPIPKQQKVRTTQPNPRSAAKSATSVESSGVLALQGQIGNGAVQRQLAQRQKAARPGVNPLDPAVMEAAARGVIEQNEAPVRSWLAAHTNRLRLLSMAELVVQVRRNVPAASNLADGEVQTLAQEWAAAQNIPIPVIPLAAPTKPSVQIPDAVKQAFSIPVDGVDLVTLPEGKLNIAARGATAKLGPANIALKWSGSIGIDIPIEGFQLAGKLDKARWEITLATPGASSVPDLSKLADVFHKGEVALRRLVAATASFANLDDVAALTDAVSPHIEPLKAAVQTLVDLADELPTFSAAIALGGSMPGNETPGGSPGNSSPAGITLSASVTIRF